MSREEVFGVVCSHSIMAEHQSSGLLSRGGIPSRVSFVAGAGDLPMLAVHTAQSLAEVYLHGAHVTRFEQKGGPPLLFLSEMSKFVPGQPIRGGVPVILPWFGPREGRAAHGIA